MGLYQVLYACGPTFSPVDSPGTLFSVERRCSWALDWSAARLATVPTPAYIEAIRRPYGHGLLLLPGVSGVVLRPAEVQLKGDAGVDERRILLVGDLRGSRSAGRDVEGRSGIG